MITDLLDVRTVFDWLLSRIGRSENCCPNRFASLMSKIAEGRLTSCRGCGNLHSCVVDDVPLAPTDIKENDEVWACLPSSNPAHSKLGLPVRPVPPESNLARHAAFAAWSRTGT